MQNTYQPQQSSQRPDKRNRARMLISCPDHPGIVAAVSHFLFEHGANIVQSDQYTMDPEGGMFFIRFEFDLTIWNASCRCFRKILRVWLTASIWSGVRSGRAARSVWRSLYPRKTTACLSCYGNGKQGIWMQILRWSSAIITICETLVESFGIPFHHIPVTAETKAEAEKQAA